VVCPCISSRRTNTRYRPTPGISTIFYWGKMSHMISQPKRLALCKNSGVSASLQTGLQIRGTFLGCQTCMVSTKLSPARTSQSARKAASSSTVQNTLLKLQLTLFLWSQKGGWGGGHDTLPRPHALGKPDFGHHNSGRKPPPRVCQRAAAQHQQCRG